MADLKDDLHRYLKVNADSLLWKLEGLSEYDLRRPLVPTGTNLLGLVKHVGSVVAGYLGDCFGRPFPQAFPWFGPDAEPNADMWATEEESSEQVVDMYQRAWAHADATIEALPIDATGRVPWWPADRADVTLHTVMVHLLSEVARHAGHADLVRELIDGSVGTRPGDPNLPRGDGSWWAEHRQDLEDAAKKFQ